MAEKIVSPGVFTKEIDQTFLPAAVGDIGAAVVGPTVKGPALVPTVVNSFSEYEARFGTSFKSGSNFYQYLTSHLAESYLKNGGPLTVVRTLAGSYSHATANVLTGSGNYHTGSITAGAAESDANTSFKIHTLSHGNFLNNKDATSGDEVAATAEWTFTDKGNEETTITLTDYEGTSVTFEVDNDGDGAATAGATAMDPPTNNGAGMATILFQAVNASSLKITATNPSSGKVVFTQDATGPSGNKAIAFSNYSNWNANTTETLPTAFTGGVSDPVGTNGLLISGSSDNLRYEITNVNTKKGTFTLVIRNGGDTDTKKEILETWSNLSLDPGEPNFITKVIGDTYYTVGGSGTTDVYLKPNGTIEPKSKYIRVEPVKTTNEYLDVNGNRSNHAFTSSLPTVGSGSFGGAFTGGSDGDVVHPFGEGAYDNITVNTNTQGLNLNADQSGETSYFDALNLLKNQDQYDFNLLFLPGILDDTHNSIATKAIQTCEDRGDCFVVLDPVKFSSEVTTVKTESETRDTSYAAHYWPWIQVNDNQTNTWRWVPASVGVAGMYSFNDKVKHPWTAPAGLNRGTLPNAVKAERKLTHGDRDDLYVSGVNPVATFPAEGVVVWGQKTLQKQATALDRVNVRRLLIRVKKFIASSSRFLVFEQNSAATRKRFLNIVNPFMEQVQANSGLSAFRVVMDETNNTPDIVDRNILYGQIYVQPTRTAEFILLDFTVQRTGATFTV